MSGECVRETRQMTPDFPELPPLSGSRSPTGLPLPEERPKAPIQVSVFYNLLLGEEAGNGALKSSPYPNSAHTHTHTHPPHTHTAVNFEKRPSSGQSIHYPQGTGCG
jgi:hypothetical protein